MSVEIRAHRLRERDEIRRLAAAAGPDEHFRVAVQLLEEQRDRPARDHPVAHLRVCRLQRIVPVALAVTDQLRARNEPIAHRRDELRHVRRHRVPVCSRSKILLAPPRDRLIQEPEIARRLDIIAQRLQRPHDDVAVAVPVADLRIRLEHEPLRPVALRFVLLRKDDPQDLPDRGVMLEREQELDRPLADVARAPGRAARLLQTMRHGQVHHGVLRQPGEDRVDRRDTLAPAAHAQTTGDVQPVPLRRREARRLVDAGAVPRRKALRRSPIGQRPDDGEGERLRRPRSQRHDGATARLAVDVEKLVTAQRLDRVRRADHEMVDGVRIALAPERGRVGAEGDAAAVGVDLDPPGLIVLTLAEDEPAEDQEPARRALDGDAPLHGRIVARRHRADRDGAFLQAVDPAAVAEAHLERRGLAEEPPAARGLDQYPQAARSGDVVGVARRREQPMERGVADREQRGEDPVHPAGRAHGRLVEHHALAGAQDGAMTPRQRPFLVAQDDVAVVRAIGHEERGQAASRPFLLCPVGVPLGDGGFFQRPSGDRLRILQQPAYRPGTCNRARAKIAQSLVRQVDLFQIGIARCLRVVGLEQAEERPGGLRPGLQHNHRRLDHRAGDFVLQAFVRQVAHGLDPAGVAVRRPEELHRIGGAGDRSLEAAVRDPRVRGALREVLAAHHHRAAAHVAGDVMVDVLRRESLVAHDEAAPTEAEVLHQDRVALPRLRADVRHLYPPQPQPVTRVQPERYLVPHAGCRTLPGEPVIGGAEPDPGARPHGLHDGPLRRVDPQIEARDPAMDRGTVDLVDERLPALVPMLDGKHASVGEHADRDARKVGDTAQPEIRLPGASRSCEEPSSKSRGSSGPMLDRRASFVEPHDSIHAARTLPRVRRYRMAVARSLRE